MQILKLIYSMFRRILRNTVLSLIKVPAGMLFSMYFLRDRHISHVVICDHIGDFVIAMGYLQEYRYAGTEKTKIYVSPRMESLLPYFSKAFDEYQILEPKQLELLLGIGQTNFGQCFLDKKKNIYLVNPANAFVSDYFKYPVKYPGMTLQHCIKYGCLGLNRENRFVPPVFPRNGNNRSKVLLLCPEAVVTRELPIGLYQRIASVYAAAGYQIFVNTNEGKKIPITEAIPIHLDLAALCSWVQENDVVIIGVRSGLLDLLAYTNSQIIAIYPEDDEYMDFFGLGSLPCTSAEVHQLRYSEHTIHDLKQIIKKDKENL